MLFSVGFGPIPALFPAGGMSTPGTAGGLPAHILDVVRHLVLPCLTLVLVVFAQYSDDHAVVDDRRDWAARTC